MDILNRGSVALCSSFSLLFSLRNHWKILIFLYLSYLGSAQDDEVSISIDAEAVTSCDTYECMSTARTSLGCLFLVLADNYGDDYCYCDALPSYEEEYSSCLFSSTPNGCESSDWDSISAAISTDCSYATSSLAIARCDDCYSSAVTDVSCIDTFDIGCLCDQDSGQFRSIFTACATSAVTLGVTCPTAYMSFLGANFQSTCSYWSDNPSSIPGCIQCQSEAASNVGCLENGFTCHCLFTEYLPYLTACMSEECVDEDPITARNQFSAACAVLESGDAADITFLEDQPDSQDSDSRGGETGAPDGNGGDDDDGPDTTTIIGVVAGIVAGLTALLVGGYFLFRKRSKNVLKREDQPPSLPPRPPREQHNANGIYEMWSSHQNPPLSHSKPPPLPYRPDPPLSELHGQPPGAPQHGYYELGPSR